jgi:DNA polymerase I
MTQKPVEKEVFLIVDALALIHRAFHAVPPLQTKDGRVVNAVYGFLSILMRAIKEERPQYVAVAFDRKEPTFRHEAFKEYKAQREKKPDDLYSQIPIAQDLLATLKIPALSVKGFEADDIIATLCAATKKEKGLYRVILTGDKDTLQLVDENTAVLTPGKGIKDTLLYDEARVRERFGLAPEQMVDFKALRGDPSDNIPGVRGIGEVGAASLLGAFGTLEKLYKEIENDSEKAKTIPKKQKANLIEFKKDALKAKELVQLVADVPLEFRLKDAALKEPDREALVAALSELDFKSMVPRVLEAMPGAEAQIPNYKNPSTQLGTGQIPKKAQKPNSKNQISKTVAEVSVLVKTLKEQEKFALRTFFDGHFLDGKIKAMAFAWDDETVVVPASGDNLKKLANVLADPAIGKICHNTKADTEILNTLGLSLNGIVFDTMLGSYILNPGTRGHELEMLTFSELGKELPSERVQADLFATLSLPSPSHEGEGGKVNADRYAAEARAVWDLAPKLEKRLKEENLIHVLERFELPLAPVLSAMERHGIELNSGFLSKLSIKLTARIAELETAIKKYAGEEVNISSPKQLAEVLFEKLKIQENVHVRKTAGGSRYSTAAGELEKLKDSHPVVPLILEHRELSKLVSTYVDALPKLVRPDTGRVHTTFNQTVTATGRLSSSDPNLQNIPIRTELGREIRKAFVAAPGHELIVADYSQIELRILAHLSQDPALTEAFKEKQDIHRRTASEIWGIPMDEVTKEQRSAAKAVNFGVAYGIGANSLAESAGIPRDEARAFIEKYFLTFRKVAEYLENAKALAHSQGYVETLFGRRRYLPELHSNIPYLRAAGERMAINAPIQGTNADAIKLAMIELHEYVAKRFGLGRDADVKTLLQVHDELVFETKAGLAAELAPVIKEKMESALKLHVPTVVDVRVGKSWGELEKFEDEHEEE